MRIQRGIASDYGELESIFDDAEHSHSLGRLFSEFVAYLDTAENSSLPPEGPNRFSQFDGYVYQARDVAVARTYLAFGKARLTASLDDSKLTHVVVSNNDRSRLSQIRSTLSTYCYFRFPTNWPGVQQDSLVSSLPLGCLTVLSKEHN